MITLHSMILFMVLSSFFLMFVSIFVFTIMFIKYCKVHKNEDISYSELKQKATISLIIFIGPFIMLIFFLCKGMNDSEIINRQSENYDVISVSEDTVTYVEDGNIKTHPYTKVEESNSTYLTIETYDKKTKVLPFVTVEEPQKTYVLHIDLKKERNDEV